MTGLSFAIDLEHPFTARPISLNNAYRNTPRKGRRLIPGATAWKATVLIAAQAAWLQLEAQERTQLLAAGAWSLSLNYRVRRRDNQPDVSNLIKLAEDATVEAINSSDKRIQDVRCWRDYTQKGEPQQLVITLNIL